MMQPRPAEPAEPGEGREEEQEEEQRQREMEETLKLISEKFNVVLAVAMGIYSLGADRFRSICEELLVRGAGLAENDPELRPHFQSYAQTKLAENIFRELWKSVSPALSEGEIERKRRADRVDSMAVDRMVHVNHSLIRAGGGRPRHLVLYLSSAPRTERIFGMSATVGRLPRVEDKPFNFHRDRNHIFYYVVYRSGDGDIDQTIKNLEQVRQVMEELKKLDRQSLASAEGCSQCVLSGGTPDHCDLLETCRNLQILFEPMERLRIEIRNLGLAQTLEEYQELRQARPAGESQQKLMEFFRRMYDKVRMFDEQIKHVAKRKMLDKQKLIFLQGVTADMYSRSRPLAKFEHLRAGRDTITGTAQYLPVKPKVENLGYAEIIDLILNYYTTPPFGGESKVEIIDRAYKLYLEREAQTTDLDPEHELVRCLLYLAMPSTEGDRRAYDHALELLQQPDLLKQAPYVKTELIYVACWAARRLRKFEEAGRLATAAIEDGSAEDARFYHGRSLCQLAEWEAVEWVKIGKDTPSEGSDRLLVGATDDASKAVELYARAGDENRELTAANYNNLAYLYTLRAVKAANRRDYEEARGCLGQARRAIGQLKFLVAEDEWSPNHPTYYHTDAFLSYNECIIGSGERDEDRVGSLERAKQQIDKALSLNPSKDLYKDLSHTIQNARERWRG